MNNPFPAGREIWRACLNWIFCHARSAVLLASVVFGGASVVCAQGLPPVMTNAAVVRRLPADEEHAGRAVRLKGVITYRDQTWGFMILQDEFGGVPVVAFASDLPLAIGNRVEVDGLTSVFLGSIGIDRPSVRLIRKAKLPEPVPATINELVLGEHDGMRVEVAGMISATDVVQGHSLLHMHAGTNHLDIIVRDLSPADPVLARLVGANVRVRGVSCGALLPNSRSFRPYLLVPDMSSLTISKPAFGGPFDGPLTAMRDVTATNTAERIRIFARVQTVLSNGMCTVADDTGSLRVRANRGTWVRAGDLADVAGFPSTTRGETIPGPCSFSARGPARTQAGFGHQFSDRPHQSLSPGARDRGRSAPLVRTGGQLWISGAAPGVVTFYDPLSQYLFIRDATNGIFVWPSAPKLSVRVSDIIEVSGFTGAGRYAPIVVGGRVSVLASGELPPPLTLPLAELMSGKYDCERVAIDGIIRSAASWNGEAYFTVAAFGGMLRPWLPPRHRGGCEMVDSEARFHACAALRQTSAGNSSA